MSEKKVGFFGGTFDPIHLGHLNLAVRIMEMRKLDQIFFSPAHRSPSREKPPPVASPTARLNMLQLALEDLPHCDPYDKELLRPPPSYTIDTIRAMSGSLYLVMAEDTAYELAQWKEVEKLLSIASPIVGMRRGIDLEKLSTLPQSIRSKVEKGLCPIPAMEVSSTEVRERLKKGLYCGHLLPGKVLDYIHQNGVYSSL